MVQGCSGVSGRRETPDLDPGLAMQVHHYALAVTLPTDIGPYAAPALEGVPVMA